MQKVSKEDFLQSLYKRLKLFTYRSYDSREYYWFSLQYDILFSNIPVQ